MMWLLNGVQKIKMEGLVQVKKFNLLLLTYKFNVSYYCETYNFSIIICFISTFV